MAGNPQVVQGNLNRLSASVIFASNPTLNVTSGFLSKRGVSLSFQGNHAEQIPTMTGVVYSPEPYVIAEVTISLLKTQFLANEFKKRIEDNVLVGDVVVRPDASELKEYNIINCVLLNTKELNFSGAEATMEVTLQGYYLINDALWAVL